MKKNLLSLLVVLFIAITTWSVFYFRMPQNFSKSTGSVSQFSTERALNHIAFISEKPHYVGSPYHNEVKKYLIKELEKLGLSVSTQSSTILSKWGNLVQTENVLARIKGTNNSKALLLLTHYDSAPHSNSFGASDDANGLGTILEGIRVFLTNKTPHKNDVIILFSDGEELGLNGAFAFASEHAWAKEVGLVINFEARGTSGPSIMLAETNQGNAELIKGFSKANPDYPVGNSLLYSVYKTMPNDTDLTAFREQKNIPGFNLAFIDEHYNYHTEQDNYANITPECIEHQASYLMPMLHYFANADLAGLTTTKDLVYWNSLFGFFYYPFWLNWILFGLCFVIWVGLGFVGFGNLSLTVKPVLQSFFKFVGLLALTILLVFGLWQLILVVYPSYQDMLHGFTYNGHAYMASFIFLSIFLCFIFYHKLTEENVASAQFASLFIWLFVIGLLMYFMPGAGFLVIPILLSMLSLCLVIFRIKYAKPLFFVFSLSPMLTIFPLIELFPVGLGLKILPGSAALVVLSFGLMLPLFSLVTHKLKWAFLLMVLSGGFMVKAHLQSDFEPGKAKFNSMNYLYILDSDKAFWTTYDHVLDDWTTPYMGTNPQTAGLLNQVMNGSKYNNGFSYMVDAPKIDLQRATVYFRKDTLAGNWRHVSIEIIPNRKLNRIDIFADELLNLYHFKANGVSKINQKDSLYDRKGKSILSFYPLQNESLTLDFTVQKDADLALVLRESSFDLLQNGLLKVPARATNQVPMPFVLNDAITLEQTITKAKSDPLPIPVIEAEILDMETLETEFSESEATEVIKSIPVVKTNMPTPNQTTEE